MAPEIADCPDSPADGLIPGDVILTGPEHQPVAQTVVGLARPCASALTLRLAHTDPDARLGLSTITLLQSARVYRAPRTRWLLRIFSAHPELGELTILEGLMPSGELMHAALKHPRLLPGHPNLSGCTAQVTQVLVDPGAGRTGYLRASSKPSMFIQLDYLLGGGLPA